MVQMRLLKKSEHKGCLIDFSDEESYIELDEPEMLQMLDALHRVKRMLNIYPTTTGFITTDDDNVFQCAFQIARLNEMGEFLLTVTVILDGVLSLKMIPLNTEMIDDYIHTLIQ